MRNMTKCGVPEEVQAKLLGGNARRFYGIEGKLFVTDEAAPIERPDWFPQGPELDEWADIVAHPRENADKMHELGLDPMSLLGRTTPGVAAGKGLVLMAVGGGRRQPRLRAAGDLGPATSRRSPAASARTAFYHEVDDEGNRLTILNGAPGRELNRSQLVRQAIWRPGMTRRRHRRARPRRARADQPGRVRPRGADRRHGRDGGRPGGGVPDAVQRVPAARGESARRRRARAGLQRLGLGLRRTDRRAGAPRRHPAAALDRCSRAESSTGSPTRDSRRS